MQTVLITGASSGIGEALANIFAREGYNLVIVARTRATLEQLARALAERYSIQVWVEPVDLSKRTAAKKLAASLRAQDIEIDILVNSAGVLEHGEFVEIGAAAHQRLIDLNIVGLTSMLDHFCLPWCAAAAGACSTSPLLHHSSPYPRWPPMRRRKRMCSHSRSRYLKS